MIVTMGKNHLKERLRITGMTCASCAARVEKSVGRMEGVESCSVNLATERMTVEFDSAKTDMSAIKRQIEETGYGKPMRASTPKSTS